MELKLMGVRRNHHSFEVEFRGDRVPTVAEVKAAEICKSKHENMDSRLNYVAGWLDAEAAIRKEAVE